MKFLKSARPLLSATLVTLFLAIPVQVKAAAILIDADNIIALVTFTFSQFEGGFSINGSTPTTGGSFTFGEGTQLNFTGQWLDSGQVLPFARTVYWENPGQPNIIASIFQWTTSPSGASGLATISGFYQARGLGTIPPGVNPADIITMTSDGSHNPFQFSAPFLTGQILEDSCGDPLTPSCPATVPVPAPLALLGLGLVGLGFSRRRRV